MSRTSSSREKIELEQKKSKSRQIEYRKKHTHDKCRRNYVHKRVEDQANTSSAHDRFLIKTIFLSLVFIDIITPIF